jgi:hypothetical protein
MQTDLFMESFFRDDFPHSVKQEHRVRPYPEVCTGNLSVDNKRFQGGWTTAHLLMLYIDADHVELVERVEKVGPRHYLT